MKQVYVKDKEGFVCKKSETEIKNGEKIITEKEYKQRSGVGYYEKKFMHGGLRENSGRKKKFQFPLSCQIRVTDEEKTFIMFARGNTEMPNQLAKYYPSNWANLNKDY